MSVNRIILVGHVGKTPEVRAVGDTKVAQFNLATTERFKGKDGNMREETEWHSVSVWGKLADVIERYVDKGTQLYVEGKIKTEKYAAKDGTEKFITRIMANSIQLLSGKKENAEQQRFDPHAAHTTPMQVPDVMDDSDLPFLPMDYGWQTVLGNAPSKANQYKIITLGGHGSLAKTPALKAFESAFYMQCGKYRNLNICGHFEFHCRVFYPSMRSDIDNSLKCLLDCLQHAKAIKNDNLCVKVVAEKFIDKINPRVEFKIVTIE